MKANQQISQYEQAQAKMSEESLNRRQFSLNESFKLKEQSAFKKMRQVSELESEIGTKNDQIRQV